MKTLTHSKSPIDSFLDCLLCLITLDFRTGCPTVAFHSQTIREFFDWKMPEKLYPTVRATCDAFVERNRDVIDPYEINIGICSQEQARNYVTLWSESQEAHYRAAALLLES